MKILTSFITLVGLAMSLETMAQEKLYQDEFPLGDIVLLDGPLKHARDLNIANLLKNTFTRFINHYSLTLFYKFSNQSKVNFIFILLLYFKIIQIVNFC